jgi:hypothetical protein
MDSPTSPILGIYPSLPLATHLIHLGFGSDPKIKNLLSHFATKDSVSEGSACNQTS